MANSDPLVTFGFALIIIIGGFIAVPYFRGKSDLITGWNALLLGLINFTALGSIEVKYVPKLAWQQLDWFQPTVKEVQWYMLATTAFIVALLIAYYFNSWAKAFAEKRLQKWPEVTPVLTLFVIGFCFVTQLAAIACKGSAFFGAVTFNFAWIGAPAACVFSFSLWNRSRGNMIWLSLFIGVFMWTVVYTMVMSAGRRLVLSAFLGPIVCFYWDQLRYWRPSRGIVVTGLAGLFILGVSGVYSKFRHYEGKKRSASGVVQQLREVHERGDWFGVIMKDRLDYFAQSTGHYSLLTQRFVAQNALPAIPLNTLRFLAVYPVPRKLWPNKPEIIGVKITRDAAGIKTTNWGVGIAGHGAYEGGIPALVLYAILLAAFIRVIDEPLRLQPNNPFLQYILASALPHIVALPRGDLGGMTIEVVLSVLFAFALGIVCRIIFGTQRRPVTARADAGALQYGTNPALRVPRTNP
jgi:hypothetical protein